MLLQTKGSRVQIRRANEETKEHRHKDSHSLREPRDECREGRRGKAQEAEPKQSRRKAALGKPPAHLEQGQAPDSNIRE